MTVVIELSVVTEWTLAVSLWQNWKREPFLFAIIFYDSKMQEHERENPKDFTV